MFTFFYKLTEIEESKQVSVFEVFGFRVKFKTSSKLKHCDVCQEIDTIHYCKRSEHGAPTVRIWIIAPKITIYICNFGHFQIVKLKYSKNWRYKQSVIFNVTIQLETSSLFIVSSNPWLLTDHLCFMVEFTGLFPLKTIVFSFHSMVDQISYQESCKGSKWVSILK